MEVLNDPRLKTLLALIALDLVMGIAAAIKKGNFAWDEVARFYQTSVVPIFLGYAALLIALPFITGDLLGEGGQWLTTAALFAFWAFGVANLLASIGKSVEVLIGQRFDHPLRS
jgi:hypothetical protein